MLGENFNSPFGIRSVRLKSILNLEKQFFSPICVFVGGFLGVPVYDLYLL